MPNSKDTTIKLFCELQGKVQHTLQDYSHPSDCFCIDFEMPDDYYRNDHKTYENIAKAVEKALQAEKKQSSHWFGCHKVHIECANKLIGTATND